MSIPICYDEEIERLAKEKLIEYPPPDKAWQKLWLDNTVMTIAFSVIWSSLSIYITQEVNIKGEVVTIGHINFWVSGLLGYCLPHITF